MIPNKFVIEAASFKQALPDERAFQFVDEASNTNLILRCDKFGFEWSLRDGHADINKEYWSGRMHTTQDIVSLLIRFGRNVPELRDGWQGDTVPDEKLRCDKCGAEAGASDESGDFCDTPNGPRPTDRCNGRFEWEA